MRRVYYPHDRKAVPMSLQGLVGRRSLVLFTLLTLLLAAVPSGAQSDLDLNRTQFLETYHSNGNEPFNSLLTEDCGIQCIVYVNGYDLANDPVTNYLKTVVYGCSEYEVCIRLKGSYCTTAKEVTVQFGLQGFTDPVTDPGDFSASFGMGQIDLEATLEYDAYFLIDTILCFSVGVDIDNRNDPFAFSFYQRYLSYSVLVDEYEVCSDEEILIQRYPFTLGIGEEANDVNSISDLIDNRILPPSALAPSTTESIYITGTLVIDEDYTWNFNGEQLSSLTMAPGAKITINPGVTFRIMETTVAGCQLRWDKIDVLPGSTLILNGSIVRDGTTAIAVGRDSATNRTARFISTDAILNNNYIAIDFPYKSGLQNAMSRISLANTRIAGLGQLLPLSSGGGARDGTAYMGIRSRAIASLLVNNTGTITPNDFSTRNEFIRLGFGAHSSIRSTGFFKNAIFEHCDRGIYAENSELNIEGMAGGGTNQFYKNEVSIEARASTARITDISSRYNAQIGFDLRNISNPLFIDNNKIGSRRNGIRALGLTTQLSSAVTRNSVAPSYGTGDFGTNTRDGFGIWVAGDQNNELPLEISENTVYDGGASSGYYFTDAYRFQVTDNFYANQSTVRPIVHSFNVVKSENFRLENNEAYISPSQSTFGTNYYFAQTPDITADYRNYVMCNYATGAARGYNFIGFNQPMFFADNSVNDHYYGLALGLFAGVGDAIIGSQTLTGNDWNKTIGGGDPEKHAQHFSSNAILRSHSTFFENIVPVIDPLDWFDERLGSSFECPDELPELDPWELTGLDTLFASGDTSLVFDYDPEFRWIMARGLVQKLALNPSVDTIFTGFLGSAEGLLAQDYEAVRHSLRQITTSGSGGLLTSYGTLQANAAGYWASLIPLDSTYQSLHDTLKYTVQTSRDALLALLADNRDSAAVIRTALRDSTIAKAAALRTVNQALSTPDSWHADEKRTNEIYIRLFEHGLDSLGSADSADIMDIAARCIYESFYGVQSARSLMGYLDTLIDHRDIDLCTPVLLRKGKGQKTIFTEGPLTMEAGPNPFGDLLRISWAGAMDRAELEMLDMTGRRVWSRQVNGEGQLELPATALQPGIYLLRLRGGAHSCIQKIIKP